MSPGAKNRLHALSDGPKSQGGVWVQGGRAGCGGTWTAWAWASAWAWMSLGVRVGVGVGIGLGAGGCATWRATAATATPSSGGTEPGGTDADRTIADLRAKNAGYVRRIEELENRVFVLEGQLENRAHGDAQKPRGGGGQAVRRLSTEPVVDPPAPKGSASDGPSPKALKAAGGNVATASTATASTATASTERWPPAGGASAAGTGEPGDRPGSLVDDQPVEYVGAARSGEASGVRGRAATATAKSRRKVERRPQLRIWASEAPSPGTPKARGAAGSEPGAAEPVRLYRESLAALRAGHRQPAVDGFRRFLASYPQHELADTCQYWIAQSDYDRRQFGLAEQGFRLVVTRYPGGKKVPDAMLKLALSLHYLGDHAGSRAMLEKVVREFPKHEAARLATAELARPPDEPPRGSLAPSAPPGAAVTPARLPASRAGHSPKATTARLASP